MRPLSNRGRALALVVLSPFLAELVSGSTAPQAWILPWVLPVFMAIYGFAALAIRELAIRTGGGPATVIVLGLAFGIVNEGMAAHSLFNPSWPGIAPLGAYGRAAGVNWIWAEWIVPFHAVWSIAFPVFLVRQIWPAHAAERWVRDRWVPVFAGGSIATAVVTSFLFAGYALNLAQWLGLFVAVGVLAGIALRWGPSLARLRAFPSWVPSARASFLVAVLFFVAGQIGAWQTPKLGPYPEVGFLLLALAFAAVAAFASTFDSSAAGERARFAFVLGGAAFYVALSPISEFANGRVGLVPIDAIVYATMVALYFRRTGDPGAAKPPPAPSDRASAGTDINS